MSGLASGWDVFVSTSEGTRRTYDAGHRFPSESGRIAAALPANLVIGPGSSAINRVALRLTGRRQELADVEVHAITAEAAVRLDRPNNPTGPRPAMLCIHGGGYTAGTPTREDTPGRKHTMRSTAALSIAMLVVPMHLESLAAHRQLEQQLSKTSGRHTGDGSCGALTSARR